MSEESPDYKILELERELKEASSKNRDAQKGIRDFQKELAYRLAKKIASEEAKYCTKHCGFSKAAETVVGSVEDSQCGLKDHYLPLAQSMIDYTSQDMFNSAMDQDLPIDDFLSHATSRSLKTECKDPSARPGSRAYAVKYWIDPPDDPHYSFDLTKFSKMLRKTPFTLNQIVVPEALVHRHLSHSDGSERDEGLI
uniref:Uncharacterized protein n=1 Tax=Kwoniella bestiolae CBS 10118 TaxID=1296100 RepID=A0A1B9FTU3_9TREE|nr:hypothetical protein I302_07827 [Kwoniella bestiolae CBS 10118]OCF22183.1 hypothetical protein I302_07827 [Kwoniella bestiolae CBS 10118]